MGAKIEKVSFQFWKIRRIMLLKSAVTLFNPSNTSMNPSKGMWKLVSSRNCFPIWCHDWEGW